MRDKKDSATFDLPGLAPAAAAGLLPVGAKVHTVAPPRKGELNNELKAAPRQQQPQCQLELLEATDATGLPVWRRDDNTDLTGLPIWAAA